MTLTKKHRWQMVIPIACLLVAAAAGGAAVKSFADRRSAATWQEAPCKILTAELEERTTVGRPAHTHSYQANASDAYQFQGRPYKGDRVTLDGGSDAEKTERKIYQQLEEHRVTGRPFRCYVNPANPSQSVLFRELRSRVLLGQAMLMVFAIGGAWLSHRIFERKDIGAT